MLRHLELLAQIGIEPLDMPGMERHAFFVRGSYACLVERLKSGELGRIGTSGKITEKGLAMLMWRDGVAWFVAKGFEQKAEEAEVGDLRLFMSDLERVLRSC